MSTVSEALATALKLHQAGELLRAEGLYRQILAADPSNPDALHFLGIIAYQLGRNDLAVELMKRSILIAPLNEGFHNNLGLAQHALREFDDAVSSFQQALRLRSEYFEAMNNLGNSLLEQGKLREAIANYERALTFSPEYAEAFSNMGVALHRLGKLKEAEASCRKAVRLRPDYVEGRNNLGDIQRALGKLDEAVLNFREGLRLRSNSAYLHNNLGGALQMQGKREEAIACYEQALRLNPDYPEAHGNLASALQVQGDLDQAEKHLREALRLRTDFAQGHNNLGGVLQLQGKLAEATACFREAMRLAPEFPSYHSNLLLCLNYDPSLSAEALLEEHRQWGQKFGEAPGAGPSPAHDRKPDRRLRIGYVSPDLSAHPIAHFLTPILAYHDSQQVEPICYAELSAPDATTSRLQSLARGWRLIHGLSDAQVAELIREDRIDILVDLAGHTANSRLGAFAYKPAPVQATYLGYPCTTGMNAVDYCLTDAIVDPQGEPPHFAEELIRLGAGFCAYVPPESAPEVGPLPATQRGVVTFGSLHNLPRLNADVLDLWCEILRALPTARLFVFRHTLQGKAKELLHQQLIARGIDAVRFELTNTLEGGGHHLNIYHHVDISLDTFPWSGHTTACESLWMGVPVVTLRGSRHAGRMVSSVLTHAGLPHLIADSPAQYVELAVGLTKDLDALSALRAGLREQIGRSPLCDAKAFTQSLESAYREMWQRWCAKENG